MRELPELINSPEYPAHALRHFLCIFAQVHGTSAGGDADELRLLSTNGTYINLRGYGGSLDFVSTKVSPICVGGRR